MEKQFRFLTVQRPVIRLRAYITKPHVFKRKKCPMKSKLPNKIYHIVFILVCSLCSYITLNVTLNLAVIGQVDINREH